MKKTTLFIIAMLPMFAFAQKLTEYKASNGKLYHIGDTIKLSRGSAPNGDFLYVQIGGIMISGNPEQNRLKRTWSGFNMIVKKIKSTKWRGAEVVVFTVGGGTLNNYNLFIEDAIATCEIVDCLKQSQTVVQAAPADNLDKLKKLKDLFDSGAITKDEYDTQKKKLLDQ